MTSHKFTPQPFSIKSSLGKTVAGWMATILVDGKLHTAALGHLPRRQAMRAFSSFRKTHGLNG